MWQFSSMTVWGLVLTAVGGAAYFFNLDLAQYAGMADSHGDAAVALIGQAVAWWGRLRRGDLR